MIMKKILWIIFFLLSIFFSWQFFQGVYIFLLGYKGSWSLRITYLIWALICLVVEIPTLKKLIKGKDIKTFLGMAYPFQTAQLLSVLLGLFINFCLSTYAPPSPDF